MEILRHPNRDEQDNPVPDINVADIPVLPPTQPDPSRPNTTIPPRPDRHIPPTPPHHSSLSLDPISPNSLTPRPQRIPVFYPLNLPDLLIFLSQIVPGPLPLHTL